jgi:hypothetical protein
MRRVSRHLLLGGALVVAHLVGVAGAGPPVAEFDVIWNGVLSSSQVPAGDSEWQWLRGRGVATIVNLDDQMFDVGRHGFESFLWIPLGPDAGPREVEAHRFLKFVQLRDNQPAHISSAARDGRALMVALLRYAVDGWSSEQALAEGRRLNGGAALAPPHATWLRGWAARHQPGSHRLRPRPALGSGGDSILSTGGLAGL